MSSVRKGRHIAYYLNEYPLLSETFIRREIDGLRNIGLDIHVVANSPGLDSARNKELESYTRSTDYLLPVAITRYTRAMLFWSVRRPVRLLMLAMYLLAR